MTNFNVATQGDPEARKVAAVLGKSISRLGTTEAPTSDTQPTSVSPFAEMAKRATAAARNIQNDAQAVINQAAAGLVEENKAVEAPETPAQVSVVDTDFEFAYGPDYWPKIEAFIGCKVAELRNFENNVYVTPYWKAYQLPDERIMKITDKVASGFVRLFPDFQHWNDHQNKVWASYPDPETGRYPKPQTPPAEPVKADTAPITPTIVAPAPAGPREFVINTLLQAPAKIFDSQKTFDETDQRYQARLAELSIKALSAQMFPGKKDGDPMRAAGNDVERELAIQQLVATDMTLINFAASREAALRELMRDRNTFEAAKLAAQLLSNQAA